MQTRKTLALLATAFALTAGMASCSNDETLDQTSLQKQIPITLTSSVTTRAISQDLQNTQIADGAQVGVFTQSGESFIENGENNPLTTDGTGGLNGETMYFPEEGNVNIYAYTPYNETWSLTETNTFTVPADQSSDEQYLAADLMVGVPANNPVSPTEEAIQLNFKHKLTKVNILFNLGDSQIDLKGAEVSILQILPTATIQIKNGTVGEAGGTATDIKVAQFDANAETFTASAVFVPQTINRGAEFVSVKTSGGEEYKAVLKQTVNFKSGKKYTYTAQFSGSGESVKLELKLGSIVEEWEDGLADFFSIGDYLLKDGTILKQNDIQEADKADVVAVIFSKEVSETDAQAGYNAYAMGLTIAKYKAWGAADVIGTEVPDFAGALADLDGRSKTAAVLASEAYQKIEDKNSTIFEYCERQANQAPVGETGSNWFVPSIGQMIQILNNLGKANITSETEVHGSNTSSPIYYTTERATIDNINQYCTQVGKENAIDTNSSKMYATVTENKGNFWCLQTLPTISDDETSYVWGFGKNAGKTQRTRNLIPCVAIKLPVSIR